MFRYIATTRQSTIRFVNAQLLRAAQLVNLAPCYATFSSQHQAQKRLFVQVITLRVRIVRDCNVYSYWICPGRRMLDAWCSFKAESRTTVISLTQISCHLFTGETCTIRALFSHNIYVPWSYHFFPVLSGTSRRSKVQSSLARISRNSTYASLWKIC